jgi:nucleoside-diphosphate-sugar epimerase
MATQKVLFIGGSGLISSACARFAVDAGMDLTFLNRAQTSLRDIPAEVHMLQGDIRDPSTLKRVIEDASFDVVVDFIAFLPEQVQHDIDCLAGRIGQYIFISSASAYAKPVPHLPITESTPLRNPFWQYSRDKIACEDLLVSAFRDSGFPATIVRPSHTYDKTSIPPDGKWTVVERTRQAGGCTRRRDIALGAHPSPRFRPRLRPVAW